MNREIVFRGKRLDNGGWVYGDLRQYSENHTGICCHRLNRTFSVDPATVGQFTGLYDKNSVKIWEFDIVEMQLPKCEPILGRVEFRDGSFGLSYRHLGAERFVSFTGICNAEFEVACGAYSLGPFKKEVQNEKD